jgi:hypothetical protein
VVRGAESASPIVYDRDDLEEMGLVSIKTSTPWNEGVVDFEGVRSSICLSKQA